ncbi:peptidoglycan-binding domain-containing protein [Bacillus coahuilensis]|uniref:peptidoglycan-binding domain-containing protein n=1 Tax=Bacillus coahuilensis TaxID=408580 RepID=UPI0007501DF9|nr:peptidoglycan-binding protein [Bacillus coahuilensis]
MPKFGADGDYGSETKQAVMNFQKANGLPVDGIAGIQTMKKVNELLYAKKVTIEAPYPLPNVILKQGSEGNNVKQVQQALKDLKLNVGTVDGIYGPKTEKAVRDFQSNYPTLKNDGIYGPNTRKYMMLALEN